MRTPMSIESRAGVVLALALCAACGRGDDKPSHIPAVSARMDGVLDGVVTRGGQTYAATAVIGRHRLLLSDAGGRFYEASVPAGGDAWAAVASVFAADPADDAFDHGGELAGRATLTAAATAAGWSGSFDTSGGPTDFTLAYRRDLDAQDSALSFLQGQWRFANAGYEETLVVAAGGAIHTTATLRNVPYLCTSAGAATLIDPDFGLYAWQAATAGVLCPNLPYTGYAFLSDGAAPLDTLTVLLASPARSLTLVYTRQQGGV